MKPPSTNPVVNKLDKRGPCIWLIGRGHQQDEATNYTDFFTQRPATLQRIETYFSTVILTGFSGTGSWPYLEKIKEYSSGTCLLLLPYNKGIRGEEVAAVERFLNKHLDPYLLQAYDKGLNNIPNDVQDREKFKEFKRPVLIVTHVPEDDKESATLRELMHRA